MKYSVDISNDVYTLSHCLKQISRNSEEFVNWKICINIDYPTDKVFLNFDIDNKNLQISNNKTFNTLQDLDTIIERIKKINLGYKF